MRNEVRKKRAFIALTILTVTLATLATLAAVGLLARRFSARAVTAESVAKIESASLKAHPVAAKLAKAEPKTVAKPRAVPPAPLAKSAAPATWNEAKFGSRLIEFKRLKKQVLASEGSRERKEHLLRDEELLRGLRELFLVRNASAQGPDREKLEQRELEEIAVDLLLEARITQGSEAAGQVLRSIVEDTRVENEQLAKAQREDLAARKAEVMYQWASQEPEISSAVSQWLPGPVSERIWRNIIAAQAQNAMESAGGS